MKHRRGIDFPRSLPVEKVDREATFESLPQWYELGGLCSHCDRERWLDRYELARKYSARCYLQSLESRLRCMGCGNKGNGNQFIVRKLPR